MVLPYLFKPAKAKISLLFEDIAQDERFEDILHNLAEFGYEIDFKLFGNAGLYIPHSLATEKLDSVEKQQAFANSFAISINHGTCMAKFHLCSTLGRSVNAHTFLHELMHFQQDMLGLYLIPLTEQGVYPVHLDLVSFISAFLFCEAWAETEAICASWRLKEKGMPSAWKGAMASPDWKELARKYEQDQDAEAIFKAWYEGKHRAFYENHAAELYLDLTGKYRKNAPDITDEEIGQALRVVELPMLLIKVPKKKFPAYLKNLDWSDERYNGITSTHVREKIAMHQALYGACDNTNTQDIKIGTPPYLWHRLRGTS